MNPVPFLQIAPELPADQTVQIPEDLEITGVSDDSRKIKPGMIFVAYKGESSDGHQYIDSAVTNGASLIVGEEIPKNGVAVPFIQVTNSRKKLAHIAAAFYGYPARKLTMIGVTGTDGKTTTANLIFAILKKAGIRAGLISTVNAVVGEDILDTGFHVTTPDAPDVQFYLSKMVDAGLTHVVLETTSHGWAQYRVDACEFDIGVVTNITHEHLDYHKTYENYLAAKGRLFSSLQEVEPKNGKSIRLAVLNRDDVSYAKLLGLVPGYKSSYGFYPTSEFQATDAILNADGLSFTLTVNGSEQFDPARVTVPLYGLYNISNCLAAIDAAVKGLGISLATAIDALGSFEGIPGRMQRVDLGQQFTAFVDFAHTPNALRVTLETAKLIRDTYVGQGKVPGRIIAVFGSAGLRDREKRRMMAETSAELADVTIITAEDPRTERLELILEEMKKAAEGKGAKFGQSLLVEGDRPSAFRLGVKIAKNNDILLCCGKGHEQSMCFGTTEYAWDDNTALKAAIAERLSILGPEMPLLPTTPQT